MSVSVFPLGHFVAFTSYMSDGLVLTPHNLDNNLSDVLSIPNLIEFVLLLLLLLLLIIIIITISY